MTVAEAIDFFSEKKIKGEMDLDAIRKSLRTEHDFEPEIVTHIVRSITEIELERLNHQQSPLTKITGSIYFSYFFVLFGIAAVIVSIFILRQEVPTVFGRTLPWIVMAGGLFLTGKHVVRIAQSLKR